MCKKKYVKDNKQVLQVLVSCLLIFSDYGEKYEECYIVKSEIT